MSPQHFMPISLALVLDYSSEDCRGQEVLKAVIPYEGGHQHGGCHRDHARAVAGDGDEHGN